MTHLRRSTTTTALHRSRVQAARRRIARTAVALAAALLCVACAIDSDRSGRPMDKTPFKGCDIQESDTPPVLLQGNAPIYPAEDMWHGKEGSATVAFTINADGSTTILQATSAEDKYFAGHTALAIRDWHFQPATRDGRPVQARCALTMKFSKGP